ncbi:MAG TPA: M42 family peptidase, partial [Sediminibacterium sp.]|nr:M42 family peptidase [Sediminibacterium sp.]
MAKAKTTKTKSVVTEKSMNFLKTYINTPSPVGFESGGQKLWMEYIKPYVDTIFTDPYGTAVGVVNPTAPFKVVINPTAPPNAVV